VPSLPLLDVSEDLVKKRRRGERGQDVDVMWSGGGEGRKGRHGGGARGPSSSPARRRSSRQLTALFVFYSQHRSFMNPGVALVCVVAREAGTKFLSGTL
jgi:hypothetical protein